jgi:hypothetical protein
MSITRPPRRRELLLAISVDSGKIARLRFIDAAEVTNG